MTILINLNEKIKESIKQNNIELIEFNDMFLLNDNYMLYTTKIDTTKINICCVTDEYDLPNYNDDDNVLFVENNVRYFAHAEKNNLCNFANTVFSEDKLSDNILQNAGNAFLKQEYL